MVVRASVVVVSLEAANEQMTNGKTNLRSERRERQMVDRVIDVERQS